MRSVPKTSEVTFNMRDTVLQVNYCETCCKHGSVADDRRDRDLGVHRGYPNGAQLLPLQGDRARARRGGVCKAHGGSERSRAPRRIGLREPPNPRAYARWCPPKKGGHLVQSLGSWSKGMTSQPYSCPYSL